MGVYVLLGVTGWIEYVAWDTVWYMGKTEEFFGYNWNLAILGYEIMISGGFFAGLFGFVFSVIGGLIDVLIYLVIILFCYVIFTIIQLAIQFVLLAIIPFGIPIFFLIGAFKSDRGEGNFVIPIITAVELVLYILFTFSII